MKHKQFNIIAVLTFMAALPLLSGCVGPRCKSVFAPSRPDVPAIVFDSTEHDFGAVATGSENTRVGEPEKWAVQRRKTMDAFGAK